jgi:hypothetical protein
LNSRLIAGAAVCDLTAPEQSLMIVSAIMLAPLAHDLNIKIIASSVLQRQR